jgi:hypothetical protein
MSPTDDVRAFLVSHRVHGTVTMKASDPTANAVVTPPRFIAHRPAPCADGLGSPLRRCALRGAGPTVIVSGTSPGGVR